MNYTRSRLFAALFALALASALVPAAPPAAAMQPLGYQLSAKQFSALADDAAAAPVNPAGLIGLGHRGILLHLSAASLPGAHGAEERLFTYAEPDTGLGAGALTLRLSPEATEFLYTVARMVGPATAAGANLKYRSAPLGSWWAVDFGLQHAFGRYATVGAAIRSALSSTGKIPGGGSTDPLAPALQAGLALGDRNRFFLAADYVTEDVNTANEASSAHFAAGASLGGVLVWGGQRAQLPSWERVDIAGVEVRFGSLQLDVTVFDITGSNRTVSIGIAYFF